MLFHWKKRIRNWFVSLWALMLTLFPVYFFLLCFFLLQVSLKKGYNLQVSKGTRNLLIINTRAQKSGTGFARKVLTAIYGIDQVQQMTTMGRKKGSVCVSPSDLSAMFGEFHLAFLFFVWSIRFRLNYSVFLYSPVFHCFSFCEWLLSINLERFHPCSYEEVRCC